MVVGPNGQHMLKSITKDLGDWLETGDTGALVDEDNASSSRGSGRQREDTGNPATSRRGSISIAKPAPQGHGTRRLKVRIESESTRPMWNQERIDTSD
eukprot:4765675-Pyramimonas_sp.AAC.1